MSELKDSTVEKTIREAVEAARRFDWADLNDREVGALAELVQSLLKWNRTFNLTSITEPSKVAELHILDSLAVAPHLPERARVLDVGAGAGFPGLVVAIARPDTEWTLVDRTEKKVAFMRTVIARQPLTNATAAHIRLEGAPEKEGLELYDVVVSRAFAAPERWLPFAAPYTRPGGFVIAMLGGQPVDEKSLAAELQLDPDSISQISYRLPSGAQRGLLFWRKPAREEG